MAIAGDPYAATLVEKVKSIILPQPVSIAIPKLYFVMQTLQPSDNGTDIKFSVTGRVFFAERKVSANEKLSIQLAQCGQGVFDADPCQCP